MKRLETIITDERNIGLDFIVHVQNKKELEELAAEDNYDTCFRIRNRELDRCIACHPSVEHWRIFTKDILEIQNGNLQYNEGDYSSKAAAIEAERSGTQSMTKTAEASI